MTDSLRAIVRNLVRDDQAAEDVLQEARLESLRRPPDPCWPPGAWVRSVVRNLVRQRRRSEERRARRERAAARPEAVESAEVMVERMESLREVVDALQSLDEPYRQVLGLRYLENLPPR